jgi:hypothetical protein
MKLGVNILRKAPVRELLAARAFMQNLDARLASLAGRLAIEAKKNGDENLDFRAERSSGGGYRIVPADQNRAHLIEYGSLRRAPRPFFASLAARLKSIASRSPAGTLR